MRFKFVFSGWVIFLAYPCEARDLGIIGPTFEIQEKNLLKVIEERLKDLEVAGKLESHHKTLQERVRHSIVRPQPVAGFQKATSYTTRNHDPSFVLDKDIKDHEGNLIAKKGSIYNPLDNHSFGKPLVFIDGDDLTQVTWALAQKGKIVLIQGTPLRLAKSYGKIFFFDQGGVLSKKFGLTHVPAKISQFRKALKVEEIPLGKDYALKQGDRLPS